MCVLVSTASAEDVPPCAATVRSGAAERAVQTRQRTAKDGRFAQIGGKCAQVRCLFAQQHALAPSRHTARSPSTLCFCLLQKKKKKKIFIVRVAAIHRVCVCVCVLSRLDEKQRAALWTRGLSACAAGAAAALVLAGGQGTRLGFDKPKVRCVFQRVTNAVAWLTAIRLCAFVYVFVCDLLGLLRHWVAVGPLAAPPAVRACAARAHACWCVRCDLDLAQDVCDVNFEIFALGCACLFSLSVFLTAQQRKRVARSWTMFMCLCSS